MKVLLHPIFIALYSVMAIADIYIAGEPFYDYLTIVLNLLGITGLSAWALYVSVKSKRRLHHSSASKLLTWIKIFALILILSEGVLGILDFIEPAALATESDFERGEAFTYARVYYLSIAIWIISSLSIARNSAKLLCSAESSEIVSLSNYFLTFIFFLFPFIGAWFINARVKSLERGIK